LAHHRASGRKPIGRDGRAHHAHAHVSGLERQQLHARAMSEAGAHTSTEANADAAQARAETSTGPEKDAANLDGDAPRLSVSTEMRREVEARNSKRSDVQLGERARARLTQLLVGKSILEALFVSALAVAFIHQAFNPFFRGSVDSAEHGVVVGWVVDVSQPAARVEVQLYIDGHFAGRGRADQRRPDVLAAGRAADEFHGFNLKLPPLPPGAHEARVYALHTSGGGRRVTLQQMDKVARFNVPVNETSKAVPAEWWTTPEQK